MSIKLFRTARLISASRPASPILSTAFQHRSLVATIRGMAVTVDSSFISRITSAEKQITHRDEPVADGPTAQAQFHANQPLTSQVIHDITMGERKITGLDGPVQGGPTSIAQSILDAQGSPNHSRSTSGVLDSETIAKVFEKEKEITGIDEPVRRGPTAKAQ
ncbi:hypothetical protein N0V90_000023 [Kalmusia sp. IMI 367209]|nr:hypothetical protein N0V90_000023 [Kalmusia sp. IMI 367209]